MKADWDTSIVQLIGYIGRALSSQESPNWTLGPYIIQTLLLLVAPALFAASIYMVLGRIIELVDGEAHSVIKKKWLTKLFVTGDIISFTVQGAGRNTNSHSRDVADIHLQVVESWRAEPYRRWN